jgi:uridine phosphorylase
VPSVHELNEQMGSFHYRDERSGRDIRITNYEMETSALYGLSGLLGHRACTICSVVANRLRKEYSKDHHAAINRMIDQVLDRLVP